jgi:hypothetical protein
MDQTLSSLEPGDVVPTPGDTLVVVDSVRTDDGFALTLRSSTSGHVLSASGPASAAVGGLLALKPSEDAAR